MATAAVHQQSTRKSTDHPIFNLVAGGAAGAVSKSAVAPLERTKILCQTGESYGLIRSFTLIYKREGFRGYWKGNMADVMRVIPNRGVMFAANDMAKEYLRSEGERKLAGWKSVLAGSFGGGAATLATYPLDLARGRMAGKLNDSRFSGPFRTMRITMQEEGLFALYRGLGPTLAGCLPYEGIKFGIYEALINQIAPESRTVWTTLACGAVAGVIGGTATYPNDTVRRRMQMQGADGKEQRYRHALHCYTKMLREEGIRPFFGGGLANVWRVGPSAAIQFGAFETIKSLVRWIDGQYFANHLNSSSSRNSSSSSGSERR